MIDFIKNNINWIKDLVMLFFAGTGSIIAILTYRRARSTVLQPIRNEVIKKQSEILSESLTFFQTNIEFINHIDYLNIVRISVLKYMILYGFKFENHDKILAKIKETESGFIPCGDNPILHDIEIISPFQNSNGLQNKPIFSEISKSIYENAKKGSIRIDRVYTTKKHKEFSEKFRNITFSPFMPVKIQSKLVLIDKEIETNLKVILPQVLESVFLEFFKKIDKDSSKPNLDPVGVFNEFNHKRISHNKSVDVLFKEIRKYLYVDETWE